MDDLFSNAICDISAGGSGAPLICSLSHWGSSSFFVSKKVVNVLDSWPGENSLTAYAAILLLKIAQQLHLELISGREVGVPALARERMMPEPIPIKPRDSKPGPRRDHRSIALCIFGSFAERNEISRFESI